MAKGTDSNLERIPYKLYLMVSHVPRGTLWAYMRALDLPHFRIRYCPAVPRIMYFMPLDDSRRHQGIGFGREKQKASFLTLAMLRRVLLNTWRSLTL